MLFLLLPLILLPAAAAFSTAQAWGISRARQAEQGMGSDGQGAVVTGQLKYSSSNPAQSLGRSAVAVSVFSRAQPLCRDSSGTAGKAGRGREGQGWGKGKSGRIFTCFSNLKKLKAPTLCSNPKGEGCSHVTVLPLYLPLEVAEE